MSVFAFEARELSCSPELKPGCRRKYWRVKGKNSFGLCFSFVNLVSTRHEKDVKVRSAENDIGQPLVLWLGNNPIDAASLIAELKSHMSRHVEPALRIYRHTVSPAVSFSVRNVEVKVRLLIGE